MARLDHLGLGDSQLRRFVVLYKSIGTLLGFVEHSSQVLANDADADELIASEVAAGFRVSLAMRTVIPPGSWRRPS